jgi:lipoate-protein ligase A
MFQGTLLIENEIELFLKALRVPVEKLKKREIESLMERVCFLSDLLKPAPPVQTIKEVFAKEFAEQLQVDLVSGDLTDAEKTRLKEELSYFQSPAWIMARSRPKDEGEPIRSITQTEAGTLRVHLWLAPGGRRIRQALIAGDFFAVPSRLVHDLEASLVGIRAEKAHLGAAVRSFFDEYNGKIVGMDHKTVAAAIASAGERLLLMREEFSRTEINELFLLNLSPERLSRHKPRWLLLPYCSKNLDCAYRRVPGCDECGKCEIGEGFALARSFNMDPITVQSFEHLMEILRNKCSREQGMYVGSCCEAFFSKHQREMEQVAARGVLVNLDSTTCYDLGKGMEAYRGNFDNKTSLNLKLIEKTIRRLNVG